jgi:hypothetical protein
MTGLRLLRYVACLSLFALHPADQSYATGSMSPVPCSLFYAYRWCWCAFKNGFWTVLSSSIYLPTGVQRCAPNNGPKWAGGNAQTRGNVSPLRKPRPRSRGFLGGAPRLFPASSSFRSGAEGNSKALFRLEIYGDRPRAIARSCQSNEPRLVRFPISSR